MVGVALTAGLVLSSGAKQPIQNAEAPAEQAEQSATSSRNTSSRATLSSGKEGGRYELTPERRALLNTCLLYTSPSPRDQLTSRMPSSA